MPARLRVWPWATVDTVRRGPSTRSSLWLSITKQASQNKKVKPREASDPRPVVRVMMTSCRLGAHTLEPACLGAGPAGFLPGRGLSLNLSFLICDNGT